MAGPGKFGQVCLRRRRNWLGFWLEYGWPGETGWNFGWNLAGSGKLAEILAGIWLAQGNLAERIRETVAELLEADRLGTLAGGGAWNSGFSLIFVALEPQFIILRISNDAISLDQTSNEIASLEIYQPRKNVNTH